MLVGAGIMFVGVLTGFGIGAAKVKEAPVMNIIHTKTEEE